MEKDKNESQVRLKDGSLFAIGGVKSTLAQMVDAERIAGESVVFSIGPKEQPSQSGSADTTEPQAERREINKTTYRTGLYRYEIVNEIARGGMGSILRAEDADLRRYVAMKVLLEPNQASNKMYERFIKEAQVNRIPRAPKYHPNP